MLIWINGAFGAGKTTVAEALVEAIPDAMLYDPETVGYFLGHVVTPSPTGDFQDLPIWRTMVADLALALNKQYEVTLVVPMTVVNSDYFHGITEPMGAADVRVRSFVLEVAADELRRRILAQVMNPDDPADDERIRQWRLDQIDRCVAGLRKEGLGEPVSNEGRPVDLTIADILARLDGDP